MNQLPTELLLLIFNKININHLINSAAHVCKRWCSIISNDIVRQDKLQVVISAYILQHIYNNFLLNNVEYKQDLELVKNCKQLTEHLPHMQSWNAMQLSLLSRSVQVMYVSAHQNFEGVCCNRQKFVRMTRIVFPSTFRWEEL